MQKPHPLDRLTEWLQPFLLAILWVSGPIWLFSYGWMLKNLMLTAPLWVSTPVLISAFTAAIGFAALLDKREAEYRQTQADRSAPPRHP